MLYYFEHKKKWVWLLCLFTIFSVVRIRLSYSESSAGIGVILEYLPDRKVTRIRAVFQGSPASKANIKPGDEVVSIDGISTDHLSFQEIGKKVLGTPGSPLTLVLRSPQTSLTRELKLTRMSQQNLSPLIVGSSSQREPLLNESERSELKEIVKHLKTAEQHQKLEQFMVQFRDGKISKEEFLKKVRTQF